MMTGRSKKIVRLLVWSLTASDRLSRQPVGNAREESDGRAFPLFEDKN